MNEVMWGDDTGHRIVTARCVSSPESVYDGVKVKVPSFDEGVDEFGPCAFTPVVDGDTAVMPTDGDRCWIAFDENNEAVVLVYVPSG